MSLDTLIAGILAIVVLVLLFNNFTGGGKD
jgi:hypothetical protein